MKKQTKKLKLEEIKVKSLKTNLLINHPEKVKGGYWIEDWDSHPC